ncbi:hypothetical protein [Pseudochrobactrum asaccharolyticum]|uniref:hypothetical protein n=1 Tax=Pseudochrobactrum asaccharolyticum TaxID=354351 RepID=UPI00404385C8
MNSITRKKIEVSKSIHNLSSAVHHFNQVTEAIDNAYALTIHLRDKKYNNYDDLSEKINNAINKAITGNQKPRNNKKVGLFLNFDLEGTRDYNPVIEGYICPHLHGCIFLQQKTLNKRSEDEIIEAIKNELSMRGSFLNSQIQNVWLKKFDDSKGNLLDYLSYSSKAEKYKRITDQLKQTTFIYPFDNEFKKANLIAQKLHVNDKQAERTKLEIRNKIEGLAHVIATKPVDVFGADQGLDILGGYISLYMKSHSGKKPRTLKALHNFMAHLVKSATVALN